MTVRGIESCFWSPSASQKLEDALASLGKPCNLIKTRCERYTLNSNVISTTLASLPSHCHWSHTESFIEVSPAGKPQITVQPKSLTSEAMGHNWQAKLQANGNIWSYWINASWALLLHRQVWHHELHTLLKIGSTCQMFTMKSNLTYTAWSRLCFCRHAHNRSQIWPFKGDSQCKLLPLLTIYFASCQVHI